MQNDTHATNLSISDSLLYNVTIVASRIISSTLENTTSTQASLEPWDRVRLFRPFQLDALGIVTLLGATQVDTTVGALSHRWLIEWLPLMGAYVFATNQFTLPINHGITMYNVTEGVIVTQFAGWFARWLLIQNISPAGTNIVFTPQSQQPTGRLRGGNPLYNFGLVLCLYSLPVVFTLWVRDYWGLVNTVALLLSVLVRVFLLHANRSGLDAQVRLCNSRLSEGYRELEYMSTDDQVPARLRLLRTCRCLLVFQDGRRAYLQVPALHWRACMTQTPPINQPAMYALMRAIGWLAFGMHVLSIGSSCFIIQVWTVVILLGATIATNCGFGRSRFRRKETIGTALQATFDQLTLASTDQVDLYAAMQLDAQEERKMAEWGLFPPSVDIKWYSAYRKQKAFYTLPRRKQEQALATQSQNYEQHRRNMKERKRTANADGEIEIPLMAGREDETTIDGMERGESSRLPSATSGSFRALYQ
ncbi:hypothetical protein H2200_002052 [Cladophialophora chaetospira]|uniref:Uncharacterized protein n=1 Tax=Cladophialophora chaetospira TaxID=386627 RepID=A0AA38XJ13_9EURO|nr:hypothetical protein H2200_002052 [Cladophialophora chaetospira]